MIDKNWRLVQTRKLALIIPRLMSHYVPLFGECNQYTRKGELIKKTHVNCTNIAWFGFFAPGHLRRVFLAPPSFTFLLSVQTGIRNNKTTSLVKGMAVRCYNFLVFFFSFLALLGVCNDLLPNNSNRYVPFRKQLNLIQGMHTTVSQISLIWIRVFQVRTVPILMGAFVRLWRGASPLLS